MGCSSNAGTGRAVEPMCAVAAESNTYRCIPPEQLSHLPSCGVKLVADLKGFIRALSHPISSCPVLSIPTPSMDITVNEILIS